MLKGSLVAIVTPMQDGGALDLPALARLIDLHIGSGTSGIVIVGTTGESPTVNVEEHCLLIKTAVEHAAGRIPVIAGTGANATTEAVELTAYAKKIGASAGLSVVPYYNKPSQEGFRRVQRRRSHRPAADVHGRARRDLGHGKRCAEVDGRDVCGGARGGLPSREGGEQSPAALAPQPVRRGKSDSREVGTGGDGPDPRRPAAAAGAPGCGSSRSRALGAARGRLHLTEIRACSRFSIVPFFAPSRRPSA